MRRVLAIVLLAGCGRLGFEGGSPARDDAGGTPVDGTDGDGPHVEGLVDAAIDAAPPCTFGAWEAPVNLTAVNGAGNDGSPALSDDVLELIFQSGRGGDEDLYQSVRRRRPIHSPRRSSATA